MTAKEISGIIHRFNVMRPPLGGDCRGAADLFVYLIDRFAQAGWPDTLTLSVAEICKATEVSRWTFNRYRRRLCDAAVIFTAKDGNDTIFSFEPLKDEPGKAPESGAKLLQSGQQSGPNRCNSAPIPETSENPSDRCNSAPISETSENSENDPTPIIKKITSSNFLYNNNYNNNYLDNNIYPMGVFVYDNAREENHEKSSETAAAFKQKLEDLRQEYFSKGRDEWRRMALDRLGVKDYEGCLEAFTAHIVATNAVERFTGNSTSNNLNWLYYVASHKVPRGEWPQVTGNLQERKTSFYNALIEIVRRIDHPVDMPAVERFFNFFTEADALSGVMRFEKIGCFDIAARLDRWLSTQRER